MRASTLRLRPLTTRSGARIDGEPACGAGSVVGLAFLQCPPEGRCMVSVLQVRQLMRHDVSRPAEAASGPRAS